MSHNNTDAARSLVATLSSGPFGHDRQVDSLVSWVTSTGSTNADLAVMASQGAPDRTILVADHQTTGRGRFGRVWEASPGSSVAVSVLVRTDQPVARWPWLSLITGMAACEALQQAGANCHLKWPNDVLAADGRKLCGILSERVETPDGPAAVIGFGLNTAATADQLPVPTATSLAIMGIDHDPAEIVGAIINRLTEWLDRWSSGELLMAEYDRRCATIGRRVRLLTDVSGDRWVEGTAVGVDIRGRLLMSDEEGTQAWSAGDVVHLR